jgi:CHAT domain-containing protein
MLKQIHKHLIVILFCIICSNSKANQFLTYLNEGKWASAKMWLLKHKSILSKPTYYSYHIQLCSILNEQELSKSYTDSLAILPELATNDLANANYNLGLSRYFHYHKKKQKALFHAKEALSKALETTDIYLHSTAYLQLGLALRNNDEADEQLLSERIKNTERATNLAEDLPDEFYFYKAKIYQLAALVWVDEFEKKPTNIGAKEKLQAYINISNNLILSKHKNHPQLVHNLTILGYINATKNIDLSIKYYTQAERMLSDINDGGYGILINLSSTIYHLLDRAYEIKFNQTKNVDHLNRALVWAKQNLWLDNYKLRYEGFYYYRRYNNRENPPVEQRITKLYIKLYNQTKNKNYLSFALKYAELMRHKPITQIGVTQHLYASLQQMVDIEQGSKLGLNQSPDYFSKLVTQPEYVAQFLSQREALVSYFCYSTLDSDSLTFLVQSIEQKKQLSLVLKVSKKQLGNLPEDLFNSIENNEVEAYKTKAYLGYSLLLKPVLETLSPNVKKLIIIPPAYFSKPILFEGFVDKKSGNNYASLSYVFDYINISYATSLTHFVTFKKKEVIIDKVTIWNPDYTHTPLAEITESITINRNISKYFNTQVIDYSSKKELAEGLLNSKILQISAHANASFDNLERPMIYTALNTKDSVLFDIDFEQLKSKNSLAVFAACKSNVGVMQHNGIIDGFTRATLSAGGAGTVCALRNVEEGITTQLLNLFYKNLAEGYSSSDALYLAKKEIKKLNSNPKIWQSFIYTGADQNFVSQKISIKDWLPILLTLGFAVCVWLLVQSNFN